MKYFNNCKTIDDVKKTYRKLAKELHPDNPTTGDTEAFKAMQKEYEAAFDRFKNVHEAQNGGTYYKESTETADMFRNVIDKIIHLNNCTIEIVGSWIWVTGDTFNSKVILKDAGFMWASKKKAWYWHSPEEAVAKHSKMSLDEIKEKYGFTAVKTQAVYLN